MNVAKTLERLLSRSFKRRPRARGRPSSDERAARKYWDGQIDDDRMRRGVTDKHP
ncbi:MAG: hypothetical protein O3B31_08965 [Chloroflexi bacterium]|nr:hypothetical protein [Chloroflexota bacterium]MDA1003457.1 hypothetical protein [Chloroflexota bacterium]